MNKEEFIERFLRLESKDTNQTDPFMFLSRDRCLGIPKDFEVEKFSLIAKLKLKKSRLHRKTIIVTKEMGFQTDLLYRAMRVLKRRKKFQLGFYEMPNTREVFAIREEENLILIAPHLTEDVISIPLEDLVTSFSKKQLKKWTTWAKILRGKEYKT